jgi:hypothetical protein
VWSTVRKKVGGATLKACAAAVLFGAITYYLSRRSVGVSIASGVLFAVIVAFLSFVGLLVLAVGNLELYGQQMQRDYMVVRRKTSAHLAIAEWVHACEISLGNHGNSTPATARAQQELAFLEANVVNSLQSYTVGGDLGAEAFYPTSLVDEVKRIAAGEDGEQPADTLERLLGFLRRQLLAGTYIR